MGPICALQMCSEGVQASCLKSTSLFLHRVTSTSSVSTAFVGNTGHFDNEMDFAGSEGWKAWESTSSSLRRSFFLLGWSRCRAGLRPTRTTCNFNIIILDHMKQVTNNAFVRNVEHFDNAIDLARVESLESLKVDNIEPQKFFLFPVGHGVLVLASGLQKSGPHEAGDEQCFRSKRRTL